MRLSDHMENPQANGTVDGQTKDVELAEELQERATLRQKHITSSERTSNRAGRRIGVVRYGEQMEELGYSNGRLLS